MNIRAGRDPFVYMCMLVAQSCLSLCDPMDYSPPGSSVHGILQARILEWVAIPFSRGSSRDQTLVPHIAGRFFTIWAFLINKCLLSLYYLPELGAEDISVAKREKLKKNCVPERRVTEMHRYSWSCGRGVCVCVCVCVCVEAHWRGPQLTQWMNRKIKLFHIT